MVRSLLLIPVLLLALLQPEEYEFITLRGYASTGEISNDGRMPLRTVRGPVLEDREAPVVWSGGEVVTLGELPNGATSSRTAVTNDIGHTVGTFARDRNHLWKPFYHDGKTINLLKTLGGSQVAPLGMNNKGQVVGWAYDRKQATRAFVATTSSIRMIGGMGEDSGQAMAINDDGMIVGVLISGRLAEPFYLRGTEKPKSIGIPDGFNSGTPVAVNKNGVVLLEYSRVEQQGNVIRPMVREAWLWTEKQGHIRLPQSEYRLTIPLDLNDNGDALVHGVGVDSKRKGGTYYVIRNNQLSEMPAPEGAADYLYRGLNNDGWLSGEVVIDDVRHAFIAKPK